MTFDILPWHWIVFGIGLMIFEMFLTTFFILWFGAAAVIVGALAYFAPNIPVNFQILIWTVLSSVLAWCWFKYLKPLSIDRTKAGLSKESIVGEVGQVLVVPIADKRGKLRFPAPILGDDEWIIMSQDKLAIGDRVSVVDVSGNSLIVKRVIPDNSN
jgi:membrane protein implicated in regulation of membrane protease activity